MACFSNVPMGRFENAASVVSVKAGSKRIAPEAKTAPDGDAMPRIPDHCRDREVKAYIQTRSETLCQRAHAFFWDQILARLNRAGYCVPRQSRINTSLVKNLTIALAAIEQVRANWRAKGTKGLVALLCSQYGPRSNFRPRVRVSV
jgi:hypothetical protein